MLERRLRERMDQAENYRERDTQKEFEITFREHRASLGRFNNEIPGVSCKLTLVDNLAFNYYTLLFTPRQLMSSMHLMKHVEVTVCVCSNPHTVRRCTIELLASK